MTEKQKRKRKAIEYKPLKVLAWLERWEKLFSRRWLNIDENGYPCKGLYPADMKRTKSIQR